MDKAEVDKAEVDKAEVDKAEVDKAEVDKAEVDKAEVDKASWTGAAVTATLLPYRGAVVQADSSAARAAAMLVGRCMGGARCWASWWRVGFRTGSRWIGPAQHGCMTTTWVVGTTSLSIGRWRDVR